MQAGIWFAMELFPENLLQYIGGPCKRVFADLHLFQRNLVKYPRERFFRNISRQVSIYRLFAELIIAGENRIPVFGGIHLFQ
jgi:hypothetical protein